MNLERQVNKLNKLLETELGNPLEHIVGKFKWIHSNDRALQFAVAKGRVAVEDPTTGLVKMVMEYDWRSVLPDMEGYKNVWVMCHTNQPMPYVQWRAIFKDELPEVPYWRPVQFDIGLSIMAGHEPDTNNPCGFITMPRGVAPTEEATRNFIEGVKESRAWAAREKEERERRVQLAEVSRKINLRHEIRDRLRPWGSNAHIIMPKDVRLIS